MVSQSAPRRLSVPLADDLSFEILLSASGPQEGTRLGDSPFNRLAPIGVASVPIVTWEKVSAER